MSEFHFLRPYWFLALLPLLALLWLLWRQKHHSRSWRAVCDPRLLDYLLVDAEGKQKAWPLLLSGSMAVLLITALAGPVWERLEQPVFRNQSALVIVLDLSKSMDATDIKPSRLARARHKITDILRRRKEGQTALLVYAAEAFTVSPLTDDSKTMLALVKTLGTELMPAQGSAVDKAITKAITLLKQAGAVKGHILLLSDGVRQNQIGPLASQVTGHGHRLSVLGIGTAQGAPIAIEGGGFLKDTAGAIVIPKLQAANLQQLARRAGGRYHTLTADERDLDTLLSDMQPQRLDTQTRQSSLTADRWREQGPWLILVVLPFAALAFRRGYLAVLLLICLPALPRPAAALEWDSLWQTPEQRAADQLRHNTTPKQLPPAEVFKDPQWQAAAHYRAGRYQEAVDALQGIEQPDALYNKGNALAKLGKLPEAIQAYDAALKKAPEHEDAKYNLEQVEKMLQQQKQSKQSQQNDKQDSSDSKQQQNNEQQNQDAQNSQQSQQQDKNQQTSDAEQKESSSNSSDEKQSAQEQQRDMSQDKQDAKEQDAPQPQAGQQADADKDKPQQDQQLEQQTEQMQATEQWLRRIPDDPGGLLRRKFYYQYQRDKQRADTQQQQGTPAW